MISTGHKVLPDGYDGLGTYLGWTDNKCMQNMAKKHLENTTCKNEGTE